MSERTQSSLTGSVAHLFLPIDAVAVFVDRAIAVFVLLTRDTLVPRFTVHASFAGLCPRPTFRAGLHSRFADPTGLWAWSSFARRTLAAFVLDPVTILVEHFDVTNLFQRLHSSDAFAPCPCGTRLLAHYALTLGGLPARFDYPLIDHGVAVIV